jgi:hypothetical protein
MLVAQRRAPSVPSARKQPNSPTAEMETPPALQRLWSRRMTVTAPLPEEPDLGKLEELFTPAQVGTAQTELWPLLTWPVRHQSHKAALAVTGLQN